MTLPAVHTNSNSSNRPACKLAVGVFLFAGLTSGTISGAAFDWVPLGAYAPGFLFGFTIPFTAFLCRRTFSMPATVSFILASAIGFPLATYCSLRLLLGSQYNSAGSAMLGTLPLCLMFGIFVLPSSRLLAVLCILTAAAVLGHVFQFGTDIASQFLGPPFTLIWLNPLLFAIWQGGISAVLGIFLVRFHEGSQIRFSWRSIFSGASVLAVLFLIASFLVTSDRDAGGRHDVSPNGKYRADGTMYYNSKHAWIQLQVRSLDLGNVIWNIRHVYDQSIDFPPTYNQGRQSDQCIRWADDSKSVSFQIENDQRVTLPVP